VLTGNEPADPTVKVATGALVMVGAVPSVIIKVWVGLEDMSAPPNSTVAVTVSVHGPVVAGV
jgi:hypothetical protein